ncbi:Tetratricopeptide TPR_2 repeat protein [Chlorobium limicola DSM 245]|uniref:Tetratricopeptide TPR_2 repeat protein n=2 Tax=Chlorobium limicola TaxID=1092 RepID=B3EEM9_CHLL2|nr:Tetratricopeptide TPR_2 repeat protein [Chlorobium limicola DSM 245]
MNMNQMQKESKQEPMKPDAADNLLYIIIKYKNVLIGALVLIIALGGGTAFWLNQQKAAEQEASMQLSKIAPLLDRGEYRKAIDGTSGNAGLKSISGKHGSTPSGSMASLLLANAYYLLGQPDSALAVYDGISIKNKDLSAAVLAGTGACHAKKKAFAQAAAAYEKAAEKAENKALKAQYAFNAADNYLDSGKLEKALELYKKIVADYPGSTGAALAQRTLWQLSGSR